MKILKIEGTTTAAELAAATTLVETLAATGQIDESAVTQLPRTPVIIHISSDVGNNLAAITIDGGHLTFEPITSARD